MSLRDPLVALTATAALVMIAGAAAISLDPGAPIEPINVVRAD